MKVQAHSNGIFSFLTDKKTTYHGKIVRRAGPKRLAGYKGVAVYKNSNGTYSPGFDKDSEFDSPKDLHAFIRSWKSNPAKFDKCVREVKSKMKRDGRAGNAYAICTAAGTRGNRTRKNLVPLNAYDVLMAPDITSLLEKAGGKLRRAATTRHPHRKNRGKVRANTIAAAEREYEATHGRLAEKRTTITRVLHEHSVLPGWGKLERLDIQPIGGGHAMVKIENFKGALLAFNEQRKTRPQLFIEGGDQSVNLGSFGIDPPYHETEVLGLCKAVYYFTTKNHLRPEDGGTAIYRHAFRFGKRKPMVIYDTVNKLLSFAGGKYTILDEGIDN